MKKKLLSAAGTVFFTVLGLIYIAPILIVFMNSFKEKVYINKEPFALPTEKDMERHRKLSDGLLINMIFSPLWAGQCLSLWVQWWSSLYATSMCAWFITRVKSPVYKSLVSVVCLFHGCAIPDGYVYPVSGGRQNPAEYALGHYYHISGIWSGTGGVYVLRFCQIHSHGNRGGGP